MRKARIHRPTKKTDILAVLDIDGQGRYKVSTGIRFLRSHARIVRPSWRFRPGNQGTR